MGCGMSFVKYCLFFFNLLFSLGGLALLGLGVAILVQLKGVTEVVPQMYQVTPWLFIVIGSVMFIVAFFGCCGAVREGHCMLVSYSVFLLLISIVQVALAAIVLVYVDDSDKFVRNFMHSTFEKAKGNTSHQGTDVQLARELYNVIETKFHCCGVNGAIDYGVGALPSSCCADSHGILEQFTGACTMLESNQRQGCSEAVSQYAKKYGKLTAWIAIAVAAIEILGAIFALALANNIRNMERRYA